MLFTPVVATALLLLAGQARAHAASALAIAVVQEQFKNSFLVPSAVLPELTPQGVLILSYASTNGSGPTILKTGQNVSLEASQVQPIVSIKGTEAAEAVQGGPFNVTTHKYTVLIVDAGPPGANDLANTSATPFTGGNVVRHYLQNDLIYGVNSDHTVQLNTTIDPITAYAGPAPPAGSGPHRYVALAYLQPNSFTAPDGFTSTLPVGVFNFQSYITSANLTLLSASYFTVEVGTANASLNLPITTAVVSTTLPQYTPVSTAAGHSNGDTHASQTASVSAGAASASARTGAGVRRVGGDGFALVLLLAAGGLAAAAL